MAIKRDEIPEIRTAFGRILALRLISEINERESVILDGSCRTMEEYRERIGHCLTLRAILVQVIPEIETELVGGPPTQEGKDGGTTSDQT